MRRPLLCVARFLASAASLVALAGVGLAASEECRDPLVFFRSLVDRYRGLSEYSDSVTLERRTVESSAPAASAVGERLDCHVQGSTLAVNSSSVASTSRLDTKDASPASRIRLASQLWSLPHLALRFADEPLVSMDGTGGSLVPTQVDEVLIGGKSYLRLHLVQSGSAPAANTDGLAAPAAEPRPDHVVAASATVPAGTTSLDLFVNPRSMLVELIEHRRTLAEGVAYEATIRITPERAVGAEEADAAEQVPPEKPTEPAPAPVETPGPAPLTREPAPTEQPAHSAPPPPASLPGGP